MHSSSIGIIEGPPLTHEVPSTTVPGFIRELARRHPNDVALIDGADGRSYTYGDLDRLIGRFAAGLVASGFKPGDTLLMFAPNSIEWPVAALGAMVAGGIVSGANPAYRADELAHQMLDADARFAFTIPALVETVREAAAQADRCGTMIVLDENGGPSSYAALIACEDAEPVVASDPDALAALPFSSGTSGVAKGVLLTHRTLLSNLCQYLEVSPPVEGSVGIALLPMYHIYGFTVITLAGLAAGGKIVTVPRFEAEMFLKAIETHRVTHLAMVPPLMNFLAMHPLVDAYDLSSLQWIGCGAAPLGAALEQRVAERVKCDVVQGFGMTESSGVVALTYRDRPRQGSSGQLLPGTQARVVDPESGADLPRGTAGELWFRGPQAFKGYRNRTEATAATIGQDGWVHTGDLGYFDEDGYLFITDRLKELIKVNAFQVAPAELEALLLTHPAVADVAVIGRPHERSGEIPIAYVVGRSAIDPEAIKAWVAERVAEYKELGDVVSIDVIPKSPSGKILRRIVRTIDAERAPA
jgi:acyl-CoA synthetase (AMP-forming)/AMP-acid ligase II